MSIHAALTHRTRYRYDRLVGLGPQIVRLRPAPHARTDILSYSFKVSPSEHFLNWQQDPYGNWMARLVFPERTDHFEISVDLIADMAAINPFDFFLEESAEYAPFAYAPSLAKELAPYLEPIPGGPRLDQLAAEAGFLLERTGDYRSVDFFVDLNRLVQERVQYSIRMEPGVQTPEETLERGVGSCRDSAWLLAALFRRLGYAARFVSGYLIQMTSDQKSIDGGPDGPEQDFTDLHAWTEVYGPGAGWVGLDPTSGLFASEGHIPLAATPQPGSAAPVSGGVEPSEVAFDFEMSVRRVAESPRVTLPIPDDKWRALQAAGDVVDAALQEGDVRLTMGGEPTFIAAFDRDADEWNTAAVGPTKRGFADRLIRRLRSKFAPGGLLQYGQGKWYPGEQLPRWAFALYWRKDGTPLWNDPELITAEGGSAAGPEEAQRFAGALAEALALDPDCAQPAYEDPAEFMLRERKLAPNVDPIDNKIDDIEERTRLARVFDRGLSQPAGMVLPIQAQQNRAFSSEEARQIARGRRRFTWRSEHWRTRRGRLFLIPGDSPAGFRLPLRSLAYVPDDLYPHTFPQDPFARRGVLPARPAAGGAPRFQPRDAVWGGEPGARPAEGALPPPLSQGPLSQGPLSQGPLGRTEAAAPVGEDDALLPMYEDIDWLPFEDAAPGGVFGGATMGAIRTAITVEPRDGVICVFLPPVSSADEYVDLVGAVEEAAAATGLPVHVEGYPPPADPRLDVIKITPDPGVLEINIHPTSDWRTQTAVTETLYEEARLCGLDASKFMLDGRPTGSGGGAHVVLGGASPEDSPFLRRPDLLASILRYWQNHPSLSYFFAGMFIGPTSQAPRVDEARHDSLYELEIALDQIPNPFGPNAGATPPWLVDRLLRHLLVDVSGNTHRAEICIDKLYSPDGPTGRLGLVEFRSFEMPPHPRMNLAQMLVLRGLVALFWKQPYARPFRRFGTQLHDQYMLPHHLWEDFESVLADLSQGLGVAFDPSWFDAQFEFRFPQYGAVNAAGVSLELRGALEPWHVLGEEGAAGGTARFVDSSVERLQARVTGDVSGRYAVTCNGLRLPLRQTGQRDEHVCGVRFRTWSPASCLHPTIPPHGPLVFDIVDTWSGRAAAGCTYYATHPGGRNVETQPVNGLEAEGRRRARFEPFGHTPGPFTISEPALSPEAPTTLDLRRQHKVL